MFAIRQHELGGPDQLRYEEVADPVPGRGHMRIVMAAAGVTSSTRPSDAAPPGALPARLPDSVAFTDAVAMVGTGHTDGHPRRGCHHR